MGCRLTTPSNKGLDIDIEKQWAKTVCPIRPINNNPDSNIDITGDDELIQALSMCKCDSGTTTTTSLFKTTFVLVLVFHAKMQTHTKSWTGSGGSGH